MPSQNPVETGLAQHDTIVDEEPNNNLMVAAPSEQLTLVATNNAAAELQKPISIVALPGIELSQD